MVFDFMFAVAFIYVAAANGDGAGSCSGEVNTQFGKGNSSSEVDSEGNGGFANLPTYGQACQLEAAVLGVSIIALFFFVFSLIMELAMGRQHWRQKRDNMTLPDPNGPMGLGGVHPNPDVNEKPNLLGPGGNAKKNTVGGGFLSRLLGQKSPARTSSDGENMLPHHPSPADVEHRPSGDNSSLRNARTNAGETYIFSQDVTAPGPTTHPLDQTSGYVASSPYEGAAYSHTYTHAVSPVSIGNIREPQYEPYSAQVGSPRMNAHMSSGALDYDTYRQTDTQPPTYRPYGDGMYDRVQDRVL
ncbi:hypothetical protein CFIMG_001128RA [Ceratocystis fimbriata CBS 114723]|uniref:Uncharacterized protein n=1 Tax=Ceratocystis fimbriata CBS 114723 TaxID=1035309 RepID=A0A2C5XH84_9PEZI|nr:hypothetical protein CFIMG_001128RA [Ceratocystis fimbriata CBS 114723]